MFAARCIGVSLAVFVLLYVVASFGVSQGWRLMWRILESHSARRSADWLFALRVLPLSLSLTVTVVFTLPSFLLLEPHSTNEAIGTLPMVLGFFCVMLLAVGFMRAVAAQRQTSRAIEGWLNGSSAMETSTGVPVFRTGEGTPTLTVAGVRDAKVLVSEATVAALTPPELRTALRHEMVHVRRYDNLKKLIFRFVAFPGMKPLEHVWSEQTEMAADDAAVSSVNDALDLAAALIKVSKLGAVACPGELSTALLHSSMALRARVTRLFAWTQAHRPDPHRRRWWFALPPAAAAMICLVATYSSALTSMHAVTEWLVR